MLSLCGGMGHIVPLWVEPGHLILIRVPDHVQPGRYGDVLTEQVVRENSLDHECLVPGLVEARN